MPCGQRSGTNNTSHILIKIEFISFSFNINMRKKNHIKLQHSFQNKTAILESLCSELHKQCFLRWQIVIFHTSFLNIYVCPFQTKNPAALRVCEALQPQEEVFWPTEVLLAGKIPNENRMCGVEKNKSVISNLGAAVIIFLTISSPRSGFLGAVQKILYPGRQTCRLEVFFF